MKAPGTESLAPRDHGPLGVLLVALLALSFGIGVGAFVVWDGRMGHFWQVALLGPAPPLGNDQPYFFTIGLTGLLLGFGSFLAWVLRNGSWDRPLLGLLVFSLFADAVPGLFPIALGALLLLLAERALRQGGLSIRVTPLILPLALVLISYLTTFLSTTTPAAVADKLLYHGLYMTLVVLIPMVLRTRRHFESMFHFMLIAAVLSAVVSFAQLGLSELTGRIVTFGGSDYNRIPTPFGVMPRCTGLMLHPNQQSNVLATTGILALFFATGPRHLIERRKRFLYLGAYVLIGLAILNTWSRSGWLAFGVVSLLVPLVRWPRLALHYLLGLSALLAVAWESGLLQKGYEFARDLNASSADFRWHIDEIALEAFHHAPWFGVGVEGLLDWFNPYHLQVHNTYLQILAELGIFGVFAFGSLAGMLALRFVHAFFQTRNLRHREWLMALLLGTVILLVQNLVVMFLWVKFLWFWFAVLEAAVFVSLSPEGDREPDDLPFLPDPSPLPTPRTHGS